MNRMCLSCAGFGLSCKGEENAIYTGCIFRTPCTKRYFLGKEQISEFTARKIEKENRQCLESGDLSQLEKIRFITVLEVK